MSLDVKIKISGESKGVEQAVKKTNDAIKSIGVEAKRSADASENMSNRMAATLGHYTVKAYAAVTALQAMGDTVKGMVNTSRTFDSIGKSLEVTAGSSVNAARSMEFIRDTAQRLGLDLASSAKAFADLQAAANGTAMEGANTQKIFFAVSQAMSALGKSADDTQGALLAISQMMSKGAVSAEELRGQLGERLPGAFNLMAKALGVSTAELSKLLEQGKVGIEVLPKFAAELEKAYSNAKLDGIEASLNRIGNAWDRLLVASGKAIKLEVVLKAVADMVTPEQRNPYADMQSRSAELKSMIKDREFFGLDVSDEKKELAKVYKQLEAADRKFEAERRLSKRGGGMQYVYDEYDAILAEGQKLADNQALLNKGQADAQERLWAQNRQRIEEQERASEQATKSAQSAAKQLQTLYENTELSLQKEIALRGENTAAANMEFEVQFGALSKLDDAQKVKLLNLAAERDFVLKNIEAYKEYDDIIEQGLDLASKQRQESAADFERLTQMFSGENQGMYKQFDDAFQAKGLGIINDQELARSLENISQGLDAVTGKGKEATDQLSEYAVQAARNMQTAFADFLFDPFEKGVSGMLDSFLTTIRRMAAEAASAQLMEGLFGKSGSKDGGGLLGPLLGALSSGISGMFGGGLNADINGLIGNSALFANGGIMTSAGPVPLRKYANGGVASSPQLAMFGEGSTPEAYVPLPDGRRIPVAMENGGGKQVVNNITLNISTPNADSFRKSERQIRDQMLRAVNV